MEKKLKQIKQQAKESMKAEKFTEAFLYITQALKADPGNVELLSDRSRCLLNAEQYNLALEDADKLVELAPDSSYGYAHRAEICLATFNFDAALASFQKAFQCNDANKDVCMEGINKSKREIAKEKHLDRQAPYVGCAIGIFLSSVILVLDFLSFKQESFVRHPLLKVLICIISATLFFWGAKLYRKSLKSMRSQLLEAPPDIFGILEDDHKKKE